MAFTCHILVTPPGPGWDRTNTPFFPEQGGVPGDDRLPEHLVPVRSVLSQTSGQHNGGLRGGPTYTPLTSSNVKLILSVLVVWVRKLIFTKVSCTVSANQRNMNSSIHNFLDVGLGIFRLSTLAFHYITGSYATKTGKWSKIVSINILVVRGQRIYLMVPVWS